jgi:1,4-alpha-glucan branching enzyme
MTVPSKYGGMGARLFGSECSFRVWAPNARKVRVEGDFTSWAAGAIDLFDEGNGNWSVDVSPVAAGQMYKYLIDNAGGAENDDSQTWERADARALQVENSGGAAAGYVIAPVPANRWSPFQTPRFENFILYQLHVGTFAGYRDDLSAAMGGRRIARFVELIPKLPYIRSLGFNAVALLPIGEFMGDVSMGYSGTDFFAPEDAYATSKDRAAEELRTFVDEAHKASLAVIFDVVYNHASTVDNRYWRYDGNFRGDGGIYHEGGHDTKQFGRGFAMWKREVKDFFLDNARMFFRDYNADGLRFDAVQFIPPEALQYIAWTLRNEFPNKYLIAEYNATDPERAFGPRDPIGDLGFHAVWDMSAYDAFFDAANGNDPVNRVRSLIGWWGYGNSWNLVRYLTGSHDQIKDDQGGGAFGNRYLVQRFGGRDNGWARAKARLGWALNVALPGTPMLFMGTEGHMWGYWSPATDPNGDHRMDWAIVGDPTGAPMQRLVADANNLRWRHPALRSENLDLLHADYQGQVLAFKRYNFEGDIVLVIVNLSDNQWSNGEYGVNMSGESGVWREIFNSQSPHYGGMGTTGNFQTDRYVANDGHLYINLPSWSVLMFQKS